MPSHEASGGRRSEFTLGGVDDVMLVTNRWRCKCGDDCYDPRYDLDEDCDIDIVDITLVVAHWGERCE